MKKIFVGFISLLFAVSLEANYEVKDVALQWSAFKTPQKVAVKGTFKDMKLSSHKTQSLKSALLGTSLMINTKSVSSGNTGRDLTLVTSYFDLFSLPTIKATIIKMTEKNIVVALEMNGHKHNLIMEYAFLNEKTIGLKGTMDMMDFALGEALHSINQACFDLHKGKTWSDVDLKVTFTISD